MIDLIIKLVKTHIGNHPGPGMGYDIDRSCMSCFGFSRSNVNTRDTSKMALFLTTNIGLPRRTRGRGRNATAFLNWWDWAFHIKHIKNVLQPTTCDILDNHESTIKELLEKDGSYS